MHHRFAECAGERQWSNCKLNRLAIESIHTGVTKRVYNKCLYKSPGMHVASVLNQLGSLSCEAVAEAGETGSNLSKGVSKSWNGKTAYSDPSSSPTYLPLSSITTHGATTAVSHR